MEGGCCLLESDSSPSEREGTVRPAIAYRQRIVSSMLVRAIRGRGRLCMLLEVKVESGL